jgi:hypothetical protein
MVKEEELYCGNKDPAPKGRKIASAKYCVENNQYRRYGIEKIEPSLLKKKKSKTVDVVKERMKLRKIRDEAKMFMNQVKKLKIILENEGSKPSDKKNAKSKLSKLALKKETLIKKLTAQEKIVNSVDNNSGSKTKKNKH